jgi:1-acyl-sn-glycerol-3-phosphate acyltransferase
MRRHRPPSRIAFILSRPIGWFLAHVYWNTSVQGRDNVPHKGPLVVIANHTGFIDGPVAFGIMPRPTNFLVKGDMYKHGLGLILRGSGQIRVDGSGREALARARAVLDRGGAVGIFPEGTRGSGDASNIAGGAAWLAVHGKAPIVPLALFGTRLTGESVNVWPRPRRRLLAVFGEPLRLKVPDDLTGRARQKFAEEAVARVFRDHIRYAETVSDIPLPQDDPQGGVS